MDEKVPTLAPLEPPALAEMVIQSVDTLREHTISLHVPNTWNEQPPLLARYDRKGIMVPETERLLKGMLRHGIPPALRCAVQLSNIIQAVHPHQEPNYWLEYRTLAKARALDSAYESLLKRILKSQGGGDTYMNSNEPNANAIAAEDILLQQGPVDVLPPTDDQYIHVWDSMQAPTYGRSPGDNIESMIAGVTEHGKLALKRVLLALEQTLGTTEYVPMVPALCAILLTNHSESYAFAAVREMGHAVQWYFPCSRIEHAAWCCTFADVLRKLHLQTADYLEDRGVFDVVALAPIFRDFFVGVMPLPYVLRILDIYTLEGYKVIFRFGVALLVLFKKEAAEQLLIISNASDWWQNLKEWTHNRQRFNFEFVVRKSYGVHGRGFRKQMRFPRRSILQRILRMEEDRIRADDELDENAVYREPPARPVGLVRKPPPAFGEEEIKSILVQDVQTRQLIAQWLPLTLRLSDIDLLYSTNYHGRTLERFYAHMKDVKHSILLCEVLQPRIDISVNSESSRTVIGMYACQPWHVSTQVYGDGGCFLFRIEPNPKCWKWSPCNPKDGKLLLDQFDLEEDENNNGTALLEQFMVGTRSYISMGGDQGGSSGLRINEDLTRGESSTAVGFENEPLHGLGRGSVFEVGLVEVYGFVRQIDGRAV